MSLHDADKIKAGAEVYILDGTKVLMFERSKSAPMFPGYLVGPGGHVDANEDFLKAAIREVYEETGIRINAKDVKLKAIAIHRRPNRHETWILPVFLVRVFSHETTADTFEGKMSWLEIEEVLKMDKVLSSAKYYFAHVLGDKPGILYTNLVWDDVDLIEESSVTLDEDY